MAGAHSSALVHIASGGTVLEGDLSIPDRATGTVLFAHGSGSSRHSRRNHHVAALLNQAAFATLLIDLPFDLPLLARRLEDAVRWLRGDEETAHLPIGLFGASTGAAGALITASALPDDVRAVVSRGGRPDLAEASLLHVTAPVLLIVGGNDLPVLDLNRKARLLIRAPCEMRVVPGAGHLFEEHGALDEVARLAGGWFRRHL